MKTQVYDPSSQITEEMSLDETVKFIKAKETGQRSTAQLNTGDIILWNENLEQVFFRICNVLSHCNKSGVVFNPKKFQFVSEEVQYAGFIIGKDSIRPTDSYLQATADYPSPKGISDISTWYLLVNHVATVNAKTMLKPICRLCHNI